MRWLFAPAVLSAALAAPAQAAAPSRLLVEATEFRFTLSRTTVKAGPAIVQLAIRGEDSHDLRLVPAGASGRAAGHPAVVAETLPGAVAEWCGKLSRGRWTLYCSLEGHKKAGMRATLTVRWSPANIGEVWPTSPPTAKPPTATT